MESLLNFLLEHLSGLNANLTLFIVSMVPLIELRGGIIASALLGVPIVRGWIICILGNMVPIPFILLFIDKIFFVMKKWGPTAKLVDKLEKRALSKSDKIQQYEFWGLMCFVGIPLPGTGAWTGALIASLLRIKLKKAVPAIVCGILLASVIMLIVSYGGAYIIGI